MSADVLARAFACTAAVLAGVSVEDMALPTPCVSWTVRDLVNHIVGGPDFFVDTVEAEIAPSRAGSQDFTTGDFRAAFDAGAARAVAAFDAQGAMEKVLKLPFGEVPGAAFVFIAAIDTFTHGWDLAVATGQSSDLDPALAQQLLAVATGALPDSLRGPDGQAPFGPRVEMADPVCPADELAAFMGRHP